MKDVVNLLTERFRQEHRNARRYTAMLLVLALVTTLFVNWQLHSDGIAATAQYQCGEEEHQHTADCYEKVLVCGYTEGEPEDWNAAVPDDDMLIDDAFGVDAEDEYGIAVYSDEPEYIFVPHEHTDDCYQEVQTLACFEEEHEHTDDCFDPEDGSLICDLFEHTHDDSCYITEYELVCGLEEGELVEELNPDYNPAALFEEPVAAKPVVIEPVFEAPIHYHTDDCYEEVLVCGLEEHYHTVNCLADPYEDIEDESEWLAKTDTTLTGMWPEDLVTVAKSQLGYEQSEKNFQLDTDDGQTVRHYTRYGQWYGNPYGPWDVMFLSYCLNYADIPQSVVPQRAGTLALRSELRGSDWLRDAAEVQLQPGDIVFYNTTSTETVAVEEETLKVSDDTPDADIALLSMDTEQSEPQTEERTVTAETVGIVADVNEAGVLTVISGSVDGKVAEVTLNAEDITDVIDLAAAYAAQTAEEEPEILPEEEDGFSARVDWIGEAVEQDAGGRPVTLALNSGISLSDHIKDAVISRKNGNNWETIPDGYEFADGEAVQVKLTYSLGQGIISSENNKLVYQLPAGLTLKNAKTDGVIYRGKEAVGSYTISTSGEVEMTFTDEAILGGAAFEGNFTFEASADYASAGSDGKVSFNDQFSLTIKKPEPDIAVEKGLDSQYAGGSSNYEGADGSYYLRWYVKASTVNGTNGKLVRIGDLLNGDDSGSFKESKYTQVLGSYVEDSVKVFKLAAGQKKPTASDLVPSDQYKLTISNDGELNRSLLVEDLPALDEGESYILCYTTQVTPEEMNKCTDAQGRIYNKGLAGMKDEPDVVTKNSKYLTFNQRLAKDGTLNDDGTITWTITLKAPNNSCKKFLSGYEVKDLLPKGLAIQGDVTVSADGKAVGTISAEELKNGYTIPEGSTATTYTFTFRTNIPTTDGTVVNTATATKDGDTFTAEKDFTFGVGKWGITKTHVNTVNGIANWNIVVTNTLGGTDFTLVDVMDALGADGKRLPDGTDGARHWFYKSELEAAVQNSLTLTLRSGEVLTNYAEMEQYLTIEAFSDYNAKILVTDDTVKARAFKITVSGLAVRRMELTVPTHEDRDDVEAGETRKYQNAAYVSKNGTAAGPVKAQDTYTRFDSFEKTVSTDGRKTYSKGGTVEYKNVKDKRLRYRVALTTDADQTKEIVITDTLPANTTYKKDKTTLYVDGKEVSGNGDWSAVYADGILTLRLSNYNTDGLSHTVEFQYEVEISGDPNWDDLSVSEITYKNTAKWDDETSSTETTVIRDITEVKKTGEQVEQNGKLTNRVRYTVYINPSAKILNGGSPLTLEDKLTLVAGADAYGDISTVKFYNYEFENGQPAVGAELLEGICQILPSTEDSWLRVNVPDGMAIVMQYECEIDPGTSLVPELSNDVYLNGVKKDHTGNKVEHDSSSSTVSMGQLLLNKMDSYTGVLLKNATFAIDAYNKSTQAWELWGTETTSDSGKVTLGVTPSGDNGTLRSDTLYRIRETNAPANYELDSTPRYVLFALDGETFDDAYYAATGTTENLTVDGVTIQKVGGVIRGSDAKTTTVDVPNTYNQLTVVKSWLDMDTKHETAAPVGEIKVQLYRVAKDGTGKTAVGPEVSLNAENGWSYTWQGSDIPTEIDGVPCYYVVEEKTTGNWTLTAGNNDGIQTGKIYLWNYVYNGYELPSTGGMGTAPVTAAGGVLAAAAVLGGAALMLKKRKKHE